MADASSLPSSPVERSSSPLTMADDSSLPSLPMERSSSPFTTADDCLLPSSPAERSSSPISMSDDSSLPSSLLPDWLIERYGESISRRARQFDPMRLQIAVENLPREEDTQYIVGLIQMYKDSNTYIEDTMQEDGAFVVDLSTMPHGLSMKIWNYLMKTQLRRGIIE
ncbi:uncharacterized protein Triagg1_4749 [Trichoderma aggressivum f. europaeum]|uniref:NET domain-containing protein n=1 Tax=Trichoderma aggressivum f. europaeum TaxID=173218 RepID=A0AAE1J7B1_9HYPO|nr:hypothetical protein Triagg1_4749 [Trichoderma aggressivum f. europaeum]